MYTVYQTTTGFVKGEIKSEDREQKTDDMRKF